MSQEKLEVGDKVKIKRGRLRAGKIGTYVGTETVKILRQEMCRIDFNDYGDHGLYNLSDFIVL